MALSVFDAIASPRRREILRLVWTEEQSAGAIHRAMPDVTFGAISLQLGALLKAGLIDARTHRRNRFYRARPEALGPVATLLERMWDEALGKLKLAAELEETRRGPKPAPKIRNREDPMNHLPYQLDRTVVIEAKPETVYEFFTQSARWASWWGAGSTIDATPGGKVYIRHANGVEVLGEVVEADAPHRIVFTYGFASGKPIPPGGSRVTIQLHPVETGTRLHLVHEFADSAARDEHIQGWRFQLSLFANVVANEVYAAAAETVDAWYAVWAAADPARGQILHRIVTPEIRFRDRFSLLDGIADLSAHIGAAQRFMPGITLQRKGAVRHCQGTVLADWIAADSAGAERMSGTSVFVFQPDGRIRSATSFTNPPPHP